MRENLIIFIDFTRKLVANRYMIGMLAVRELKAAYVGSLFGFLWAVFNPLSQVVIYGVVFGMFFKSKPDAIYSTDNFLCSSFAGPWQFFSQALSASAGVIVNNRNLIKKAAGFPSEILPLTSVVSNIISHLIGLALMLVVVVAYTGSLPPTTPLVFVYMSLIAVFAVGSGWILSGLNVFVRDTQQVLSLALMGLFFFTPVFYSASIVPAEFQLLLKLNPMYHVVGYRLALLAGTMPLSGFAYLLKRLHSDIRYRRSLFQKGQALVRGGALSHDA